jgi:catechol 2,3-dioxygenase-like lactoylglutathione lyase family enzyme
MLGDSKAVAFATVFDLDRARAFYEGMIGLKVISQDAFAVLAEAGGVQVRISKAPMVVVPQPFTVVGFDVTDIDSIVTGLAAKGVVFERYPFFCAAQDSRGVWDAPGGAKVAWFKDPDGNLLSVQQLP